MTRGRDRSSAQRAPVIAFAMAFLGAVSVLAVVRATGLERSAAIRVGTWTAAVAYAVLWPAQAGTEVAGNELSTPHGRLRVSEECSGFDLLGLLAAAMLAYPVAWRRRLAGIALLVPFVFIVNVIRVVSLSLVLEHASGAFETMHTVVWQGLLILVGLAYWLVWSATERSTS